MSELCGHGLDYAAYSVDIRRVDLGERTLNSLLSRRCVSCVQFVPVGGQPEKDSPAIARIGSTPHPTAPLEARQNPGERAGVKVQPCGEFSRWNPWVPADDREHRPLQSSQAELLLHLLGVALECVLELPKQAQQLERGFA